MCGRADAATQTMVSQQSVTKSRKLNPNAGEVTTCLNFQLYNIRHEGKLVNLYRNTRLAAQQAIVHSSEFQSIIDLFNFIFFSYSYIYSLS